jgi:ubiquinone/menaquinone biosynthesis C-methylase UbiE
MTTSSDSTTPIKRDIRAWWGDLYKQAYSGHEDGLDQAAFENKLDELEDLFRKRELLAVVEMPLDELAGKRVLEIGSGSGAHSALFLHKGAEMVSVDITVERAMATARKFALVDPKRGRVYQADAENLPFPDNTFDIVYSNGVLHHSEDTERCIAEVHRVLKPGGKAVIMLYARHSSVFWFNVVPRGVITGEIFRWPEAQWVGRLTEGKPKFGTTRNPITRIYSKREIENLFKNFNIASLRRNSFQFDNVCIPKMTQIRNRVLRALGHKPHSGGIFVYGAPFMVETALERAIGRIFGFGWNIVAVKP